MIELTLLRRGHPLADPSRQTHVLADSDDFPTFHHTLAANGIAPPCATAFQILQVNVGKLCNQTCHHCHVDAGPDRRESMSRETAEACLRVLAAADIGTLDITGGAPEMNSNFCWIVEEARRLDRHIVDRCNLTILNAPGFDHLPEFLARQEVEIVASLPCYLEANCDRQRGDGVYQRSILALQRLNALGYGQPGSSLRLTLVFNPVGPSLPPSQPRLEADFRRELRARHGVEFTQLYTITNMPISRFLDDLLSTGQFDEYMQTLIEAFNPAAVDGLMCRTMLSVDWQGRLFDCDFNQMLDLPVESPRPQTIFDFDLARLANRKIATGRHCFGCTAGAGSSCQGSVLKTQSGKE
jgi:radical SAM/Cys-rich protein